MGMITESFETAEWKLVQARNFLSELLGIPIAHFSIAFETSSGDRGVVATSPRAIFDLDAEAIANAVQEDMMRRGKSIVRKETATLVVPK